MLHVGKQRADVDSFDFWFEVQRVIRLGFRHVGFMHSRMIDGQDCERMAQR